MRASFLRRVALLLGVFAGLGLAQQFPFQLRVVSSNNGATVANGTTLGFSAAVGQSQAARLTATYVGSGKITVPNSPQLFGSPEFTATLAGSPPLTLNPGDSLFVDILFQPTVARHRNAQFNLPFSESTFTTNPPTVSQNAINFTLQGTAPSFLLSYVLQADLNVVPLQPGGTINFPDTQINAISQANLNITNVGSGSGAITDVTLTGSAAFKLVGKPLFPVNV